MHIRCKWQDMQSHWVGTNRRERILGEARLSISRELLLKYTFIHRIEEDEEVEGVFRRVMVVYTGVPYRPWSVTRPVILFDILQLV